MAAIRYSKQREAIRTYLLSTKSHPTAEAVYNNIKNVYPHISLGTVYRNLNLLVEQGDALRLDCGDGVDHFDGDTRTHYHFACKKCGCVMDLEMDPIDHIDHIDQIAGAGFEGEIQGHNVLFYGLCPECRL
ncbi:MAG: transcriptional repressor [Lachnospiraceae bacterium]|nr:transcriptional repressor [Lachnospiraceae bacterium]